MKYKFLLFLSVFQFAVLFANAQILGYEASLNDNGGNWGIPLQTGFYQVANSLPGDIPDQSFPWKHLIVARHNTPSNNHQLQLASSYSVNDRLFFRKIAEVGISNPSWIELATRGTNSFAGNQVFLDGNVGIGTSTPEYKLQTTGTISIKTANQLSSIGSDEILLRLRSGYWANTPSVFDIKSSLIFENSNGQIPAKISAYHNGNTGPMGGLIFYTNGDMFSNTTPAEKMRITHLGNVGIGTDNPTEKLSVKGKIRAQEIKVEAPGAAWPDYVFEDSYKTPSLSELESYIKINKHLPEIPSAKEVEENGISLGEMNAKLLKKIEEMTMMLIEQGKQNINQQKEIELLKSKIK